MSAVRNPRFDKMLESRQWRAPVECSVCDHSFLTGYLWQSLYPYPQRWRVYVIRQKVSALSRSRQRYLIFLIIVKGLLIIFVDFSIYIPDTLVKQMHFRRTLGQVSGPALQGVPGLPGESEESCRCDFESLQFYSCALSTTGWSDQTFNGIRVQWECCEIEIFRAAFIWPVVGTLGCPWINPSFMVPVHKGSEVAQWRLRYGAMI